MMELRGKWALITGASGGLGLEFANLLAAGGANLVLAARRADKLEELAAALRASRGVEVAVEAADLARPGEAARLKQRIDARGIAIDILINNAGRGLYGEFVDRPSGETVGMLQLNIVALTELTHAFATAMAARGSGHILMVASMTAHMPTPLYAAYGASKAYVRQFGEALHAELAPRGVTVSVLTPGLMATGFLGNAGQRSTAGASGLMIEPRRAAEIGLRALARQRQEVIAGRLYQVIAGLARLTTRRFQTALMHRQAR